VIAVTEQQGQPPGDEDGPAGAPREPEAASQEGAETEPKAEADRSASEPEGAQSQAVPLHALRTHDLLVWMLSILAAKAWEAMGLVANPMTNKVEKNMEEARLAIDAYAATFEVVRVRVEDRPRRDMETLLTTLRLNFVEKSGE
jgi:hypothetical protein